MTARSTTTDGCLFIGGEFRPASDGATLETFNPPPERVLARWQLHKKLTSTTP